MIHVIVLQLVFPDGHAEERPFAELNSYTDKEEDKKSGFKHDIVRIYLPAAVLKVKTNISTITKYPKFIVIIDSFVFYRVVLL